MLGANVPDRKRPVNAHLDPEEPTWPSATGGLETGQQPSGPDIVLFSSVGGGVFGASVVEEMNRLGCRSEFDFTIPIQEYWNKRGLWHFFALRWRMYVSYPLFAAFRALRGPRKILIVTTNPFFLPLLLGCVAKIRRHRVFQWLFDLYPDALIASGRFDRRSPVALVLSWVTRRTLQICDATVFLGRIQREYVIQTYGEGGRSAVIPVGGDASPFTDTESRLVRQRPVGGPLVFVYSGHFGRMHDFEVLQSGIRELYRSSTLNEAARAGRVCFKFHASGPNLEQLLEGLPLRSGEGYQARFPNGSEFGWRLEVGGNLEAAPWSELMRSGHVALVTVVPPAAKVLMPSKTYSAMLAGQAVLAICPLDSDLAETVLENRCGWVIVPGQATPRHSSALCDRVFYGASGFVAALLYILHHPDELHTARVNAFRAASESYRTDRIAKAWVNFVRNGAEVRRNREMTEAEKLSQGSSVG
jgi:colanic acid biosynthesis glycosyl transferase WcaI